jgi:hypothetical protein
LLGGLNLYELSTGELKGPPWVNTLLGPTARTPRATTATTYQQKR